MNYETATNRELEQKLQDLIIGSSWILTNHYCTDWNATMPIAVDYGVSYEFFGDRVKAEKAIITSFGNEYITAYDDNLNPLRAIVICLIKVLESK